MLRRDRQLRTQLYQIKDAVLFALALWIAWLLRASLEEATSIEPLAGLLEGRSLLPFGRFAWLYLMILPLAPFLLELQGFYQRPLLCSRPVTAWLLFKACVLMTLGIIVVLFLFGMKDINRLVIIFFGVVSFILVFVSEELLRLAYKTTYGQSQLRKRIMLIGAPEDTARIKAQLAGVEHGAPPERARPWQASLDTIEIVAELDINENADTALLEKSAAEPARPERPIEKLVRLLHERSPNGVILNPKHTYFGQIEKAIQACELEGVDVWLIADFFRTQISRTSFDEFHGRPVILFRSVPEYSWQGIVKQLIDVLGALFLLLIFGLPLLAVALAIRLTTPKTPAGRTPVLFRQRRCGLNGRPFTMLKFRTMVSDAEQRKAEFAALNEMTGPVFKLTNDPRITPIGRFLRKWSLDEFPQLLNVLRGEMSLVGPRPLPVDEVERFDDPAHRRRLSVKPGLTCLWQISGRNNVCDFNEWVRLDLEYIDNWSLWLDLKILCRTIPVVLVGTGAK